jgi:hypothetical protein
MFKNKDLHVARSTFVHSQQSCGDKTQHLYKIPVLAVVGHPSMLQFLVRVATNLQYEFSFL